MMDHTQTSREAFEEQVLPHLSALYRFALYLSGDRAEAEDLVQETMLLALRAWDRLEPASNVRAWLIAILRHRFYNEYRRSQHFVDLGDDPEPALSAIYERVAGTDPEGEFFSRIVDARIWAVIEALPAEYRTALVLSDVDEMSYAEIAQVLAVPIGTVRSRIFRARRSVQGALHGYAVEMGYIRAAPAQVSTGEVCQADRGLLLDYLKEELGSEVADRIGEHLEVCCDCAACVRFERHYLALMRTALERQRCPEATRQAVLARLARADSPGFEGRT